MINTYEVCRYRSQMSVGARKSIRRDRLCNTRELVYVDGDGVVQKGQRKCETQLMNIHATTNTSPALHKHAN